MLKTRFEGQIQLLMTLDGIIKLNLTLSQYNLPKNTNIFIFPLIKVQLNLLHPHL